MEAFKIWKQKHDEDDNISIKYYLTYSWTGLTTEKVAPEMPKAWARETGSTNQPRLSLAIWEGIPELNLTKLAFKSSSLLHPASFPKFRPENWEVRCILIEIQVMKRKTPRTKGRD